MMLGRLLLTTLLAGSAPLATRAQPAGEPELPLEGAIVVVDPGHGGQRYSRSYTGGTRGVASRQTESELNLRVSLELAKLLRAKGAVVHLTREADHRLIPSVRPRPGTLPSLTPADSAPQPISPQT